MIKFIYFDLGGVVVHDFSGTNSWQELKDEIGIAQKDNDRFDKFFDKWEIKLNKGKDLQSLVPLIEKDFNIKFPTNFIFLDSFVNKFKENTSIWEIVQRYRQKYKIGLLTNMYPGMFTKIQEKNIMPNLDWDVIVDSSKVGFAKPEKEIYEISQKLTGVKKDEILFIDNMQKNLDAAKAFGWQTFHYDPKDTEESNKNLSNLLTL